MKDARRVFVVNVFQGWEVEWRECGSFEMESREVGADLIASVISDAWDRENTKEMVKERVRRSVESPRVKRRGLRDVKM
jgi:glutamate mutase epsilon subunit